MKEVKNMSDQMELERAKRLCRTFIDGKPLYEVLPKMYEHATNPEIARKTGLSRQAIRLWAKRLNLSYSQETIERIRAVRTANIVRGSRLKKRTLYQGMTIPEIVQRYFPQFSSREIEDKFGCSSSYVRKVARDMGIKHSAETKKRIIALRLSRRTYSPMTEEQKRAWIEKCKKSWRLEKWKQENGIKRRTKWRISPLTKKQRKIKYSLCSKRNYFSDCSIDPFALFYDGETKRFSPTYRYDEEHYSQIYGLRFLPADGYDESLGKDVL